MHRDPAGLAVRDLGGRVDLDRVDLGLVDRAGPADPGLGLGLAVLVGRAGLDPVVRDPVGLADQADIRDLADLADLDLVARVVRDRVDRLDQADIRDRAGRVDPAAGLAELDLAARVVRVDLGRADRVALGGLADLAVRLDRHQRHGRPGVLSTGVAPRWAAPGMCHKASARPATVRRLRRHSTDGAGMAGLRPERRRLGGTDRRPRVDGAVRRLPVVGTVHGTGRRAISGSRSVISGRSITTAITRSRCSTRFSGDGASGSSVSGSRCTNTI
jgi:hypothetical protein